MVKVSGFSRWQAVLALGGLAWLAVPATVSAAPQDQAIRDQVIDGVRHCAAITDDRQWLDCYYGAAQPMRAHLGLPPAPQFQQQLLQRYSTQPLPPGGAVALAPMPAAPLPPPVPKPKDEGFFSSIFGGSPVITNMPMRAYSFNSDGTFVATLADGTVWQQRSGSNGGPHMRWTVPASSLTVSITTGVGSADNMTVNGGRDVFKVHRVR